MQTAEARGDRIEAAWHGPRLLLGVWAIAIVAYLVALSTDLVNDRLATIINDVAWTLAAGLATFSSARAALTLKDGERVAWWLFTAACAAWTCGQLVWDFYQLKLGEPLPFPSYADIGYLAFAPLMIAGLFALRTTQQERRLSWLRLANMGLILCSLVFVVINTLSEPFATSMQTFGSSLLVLTESAGITIAFITAVYVLWAYEWGTRLMSYGLVTVGLALQMILAMIYTRVLVTSSYSPMSLFNLGWILAFALHQTAAEVQVSLHRKADSAAALRCTQGWVEALTPSFLVLCMAISAAGVAHELTPRTVAPAVIAMVAFAAILAVRESWLYLRGQQLRTQLDDANDAVIQARKQLDTIESQRADLERLVRVTARAGAVGLWQWDVQNGTVRFSQEWRRQLGYASHEIADDVQEFYSRLHPDDRQRVDDTVARCLADANAEYNMEIRMRHRDGSYRWILTRATVLRDQSGHALRILGSHVDITAIKDLEFSLRQSEARYKELVDDLERRVADRTSELTDAYRESQNFAYAVAHDLKAPLRAMNSFGALLQQSATGRLDEREKDYLNRIQQGAMRMSALIDSLLAYSRMEHREQQLRPLTFGELVQETLESMASDIQSSGAEVDVDIDPAPVLADREGLQIALRNLLDNALKFSRDRTPPRIQVRGTRGTRDYTLEVSDNGIGFDPQYKDKIFDIFNRLHAVGYEGTGIGLALVRKAINRMRGQVRAESTPGAGAKFSITLPLAEERSSA